MADTEPPYKEKRGGLPWTLSTADGKKTGELALAAPPSRDGLAVAGGFCYLNF